KGRRIDAGPVDRETGGESRSTRRGTGVCFLFPPAPAECIIRRIISASPIRRAAMSFKMDRVHVWATEVKDEPGGVAAKLSRLDEAGADLEYVHTQRLPDRPGHGILYVAPLSGLAQLKAAKAAGLHETSEPIVMRIEGDN